MQAVLLAGGFGTRLRAVVPDLPKPLAPVAGRPFITILLDQLNEQGFRQVILSVGYRHELIQQALGERYRDIELTYSVEAQPLGTGGAIRLAARQCDAPEMFVLNGDSYVDADYATIQSIHRSRGAQLTLCVTPVPDAGRYGRVVLEADRVIGFVEKGAQGPGMINAGVYLLAPSLVLEPDLPDVFSFEQDFLQGRLKQLNPMAVVTSGAFIDIGVPEDYARANAMFAGR